MATLPDLDSHLFRRRVEAALPLFGDGGGKLDLGRGLGHQDLDGGRPGGGPLPFRRLVAGRPGRAPVRLGPVPGFLAADLFGAGLPAWPTGVPVGGSTRSAGGSHGGMTRQRVG